MTPREYVMKAYQREIGSVLNRDHTGRPHRGLAFAAARNFAARSIARDVAAGITPSAARLEEFRLLDAIVLRQDERICDRWRAERDVKTA